MREEQWIFCPKCKQETLIHVRERKVYAAADRAHD